MKHFSKRHLLITIATIMMWSLINVTSVFAQVSIDDPVSGTTLNATQYSLFEYDTDVSGGLSPYAYTDANLPAGFSIDVNDSRTDAKIIGVASVAGTYNVTLTVTDSKEGDVTTSTSLFTIEVASVSDADFIDINVPDVFDVTDGQVGETYSTVQFSTDEDTIEDRFEWSVDTADLPDGMVIDPGSGQLIGIPTESGEFIFTVNVEDPDTGNTGTRVYRLTVNASSSGTELQISSPSGSALPSGVLNRTYTADVDAVGGDGSYTFTQSGLPSGLNISSSTGIITGTPLGTGTFNVSITVTDGTGATASRNYSITISETGTATYGSAPSPGATIDFGNVNVGSTFTLTLIVSEEGTDQLDVSQPSGGLIQGVDASAFTITTNSPPFSIVNGGTDIVVQVRCAPTSVGDFDAFLQFATNDSSLPVAVYSLFCTGVESGGSSDPVDTGTDGTTDTVVPTFTPSIPTQTPLPPTYTNVIEVKGLSLRSGPFIGSSRLGVLRPNINYRVTAKNNQEGVYMWYYVETDEGVSGWASGRYLAVYGQDVPFSGSIFDNVFNERDRGVRIQALDNLHFRPGPSDRTQPYVDLIPWGAILKLYARTVSGRGDEWYAVEYNGVYGWVYAPNTRLVEGLMDAVPKY